MNNNISSAQIFNIIKKQILVVKKNQTHFNNDELLYDLLLNTKDFLYNEIHNVLFPIRKYGNNEKKIREYVKYVISDLLIMAKTKVEYLRGLYDRTTNDVKKQEVVVWGVKYAELWDDLKALASFRSFAHFALYIEEDDSPLDKVWLHTMDHSMGGIFHYGNEMILNHTYQYMVKQCPTGYGKTKSDNYTIAFALGYDKSQSILKVTGTKAIVGGSLGRIEAILTCPKFLKVFPEFKTLIDKYSTIIKNRSLSEGKFTLYDANPDFTFRIVNKETATNGVRANIIMLDDVCRAEDAENLAAHLADIKRWNTEWKKRRHDEHNIMYIITGTAYHKEDIISYIIKDRLMNKRKVMLGDKGWQKFTGTNEKQDTIFVSVPKIDNFKKDRSLWICTFPEKYTLNEAIKEMNADKRSFMAMDQQEPMNPESLPFDPSRCIIHETLPEGLLENGEATIMVDPARKGKDYTAAGIFMTLDYEKPQKERLYYMVDCYCKKKAMEEAYDDIADLIIRYEVEVAVLESNTESSIRRFILETLSKKGYNDLNKKNVMSITTTENKENKISRLRGTIVKHISFPDIFDYNDMSDMHKFLKMVHEYSLEKKNVNDDAPDCCAMFVDNIIAKDKLNLPKFKVLDRRSYGF